MYPFVFLETITQKMGALLSSGEPVSFSQDTLGVHKSAVTWSVLAAVLLYQFCYYTKAGQTTISFGFVTGHLKENLGFATRDIDLLINGFFPLTIMFHETLAKKDLKTPKKYFNR